MARFMLTAMPFTGHVTPLRAVAAALVSRGHDVRVVDDLTSFDVTRLKQADALMARLTRYQRWQRLVLLFFS